LGLPLVSSGQVIGAIGLHKAAGEEWIPEEITLVRAVGEQVAQALERMRLLEQTRSHAQRESILRRTSERVRAQASLDAILQAAVVELREAVGATRVALRLGGASDEGGAEAGQGGQAG
jgi:GAF domain-containing protein